MLGVGRTRDGQYLIGGSRPAIPPPSNGFKLQMIPRGTLRCIEPRRDNVEYSADHREGIFFIRVNDTGRNFRLVTAKSKKWGREHWQDILPHRDEVMLEDVDLFRNFFVAFERFQGLPRLRIYDLTGEGTQPNRPARLRVKSCFLSRPTRRHLAPIANSTRHTAMDIRRW